MENIIQIENKVLRNKIGDLPEIVITAIKINSLDQVNIYNKNAKIEILLLQIIDNDYSIIDKVTLELNGSNYESWNSDLPYLRDLVLNRLELTIN